MQRYIRNIKIPQINENGQKQLLNSRVLVAGAGGLGSSVIANLASLGIGCIGIVDSDVVELSNLNRQFIHKFDNIGMKKTDSAEQWIKSYNPDITVKNYQCRLDESNFKDVVSGYDLLVDCFDSFESKFLLNKICVESGLPFIHAGVSGFGGQVLTVIPGESACLRCIFDEPDKDSCEETGVVSPAVSVIGAVQAMEVLKFLLRIDGLLTDRILIFDGLKMNFRELKIAKSRHCIFCGK